jgi:DNA-binding response OmpR family regulator
MKILIADDDAVSRRLLQSYLEKWGHQVSVAEDGAAAWRAFEAEPFPIVISDWMMPGMDGVELLRRIRAHGRAGYVYTILVTARAQKEDVVEGMEAGADDFVTKPFDRDELRVRLRAGERIIGLEQELSAARAALQQREGGPSAGAPPAPLGALEAAEGEVARIAGNLVTGGPVPEAVAALAAVRARLGELRTSLTSP